jgi:outer membrane receptor protein involved in Fe transport
MRKFKLSVVLLLLSAVSLYSQKAENTKVTVTGVVVDAATGKTIEYPTVAIFTDSLKLINAAAGGVDGKFSLEVPAGKYIFSASTIGYTNYKNQIVLENSQRRVDLGKIEISEGTELKEITVTGVRPLVKNEPDKLTYNIDADPMASSSVIADILRKVPMISVDGEGTVRLNGETNFKVLVNGRSSGMLVKNFKDAIKAMPANTIKSIEVITNPPAKYDAEGVGGVINIITNRKTTQGYNGNINAGLNTLGGYNAGGYISAQVGKFAISTNIYHGNEVSKKSTNTSESENFISEDYRYSQSTGGSDSYTKFTFGNIEASYEIDSLNLITLSGGGYLGNSISDGLSTFTSMNLNRQITRKYTTLNNSENGFGSVSGSLSYQKTYKKPDQNLTFSYSIDASPMNTDITSEINPEINFTGYKQHSENSAKGLEHTVQVDYYDPLNKKHMIEVGGKYILRQNTSDSKIERFNGNSWVDDPSRVNDLDYDQHIASMYGGYAYKYKTITAKAGFRGEYTFNDGLSKSFEGNIPFTNKQFDVVPYINLNMMLKKGNMLSFAYTQRLNRPGIWYLNPYVNDSDPMNIRYGNPELETVRRNSVNVGYRKASLKWNFGVNLSGNFSSNNIEEIRRIDEYGVNRTTYENIGKNSSYRMNLNYSYRAGEKLNINLNGAVAYTTVSSADMNLENDGFSFNGGMSLSAALWKKATISFDSYLFGGDVSLQSKRPLMVFTGVGFRQRLLNDKLTFSISVRDPFSATKTFEYDSNDLTYKMNSKSIMYTRSATFSLFWRFGKFNVNVRKARKSATDDKIGGSNPAATTTATP